MADQQAKQTPLVELLAAVPADVRVCVRDGKDWNAGTTWHPVGRLCRDAAAELRRLVAENIELKSKADVAQAGYLAAVQTARWQESTNNELNRHMAEKDALRAQRDELLEVLREFVNHYGSSDVHRWMEIRDQARAAIAKAEAQP